MLMGTETQSLAIDSTSVIAAAGGVIVALIGVALAIWQAGRNRALEREKAEWQFDAVKRERQLEWDREEQLKANEEERNARQAAARRSGQVAAADEYRARLAEELSRLHILDMSRPLDLDRLYVQVRVQEQQPLRFVRDEELEEQSGQEAEEPRAGGAGSAQTFAPVDALRRYQRMVVVGDPGAGKTTMLRHLALRTVCRAADETLPDLPVYVELSRFVQSRYESLLEYVAELWAEQYAFRDARDYLDAKLNEGSAALLLDGLDEVLGGESSEEASRTYDRTTAEVTRLATRYPRALIAVTCRRHGWNGGLSAFQVLEALDFEWPQIETFIANWFGERDRRNSGLVRALTRNVRLQTLAANPLLLSLIAIVYERDLELPERRAELYKRCVEVLLREWDTHRKISRYSRFTTDRKQDLLKQVAWHYHLRGERYFREEDLLGLIAEFLPTIDLPAGDSRAILDEIAAQYGLIKAQAHGWYGFLHLTLQEHFAAVALLERGAAGVDAAVARRYDPWWEEVILLLSGSLPDATGLLLGLLQLQPGERETTGPEGAETLVLPNDDLFHTDLLLAARCLSAIPRVTDVALRRQIIRGVWRVCETSPHTEEVRRVADAIVGFSISREQLDEVIGFIGNEAASSPWARGALAGALGRHGGRGAGERLLGLLAMRPDLDDYLRADVFDALGALRVEAAGPRLLDEVRTRIARLTDLDLGMVEAAAVRALGSIGGYADLIVRELEGRLRSGAPVLSSNFLVPACCEALAREGDAAQAPRLLELLREGPDGLDWLAVSSEVASTYLRLSGEPGLPRLLDVIASEMTGDHQIGAMRGLAEFVAEGHGRTCRDRFLALAADDAMAWEIRWLALECLDGYPGATGEVAPLLDHPSTVVKVAAAATLAAWGTPMGLDLVRDTMVGDAFPSHSSPRRDGRIAARLGRVLAPYGASSIARQLYRKAAGADPRSAEVRDALWWLRELDSDTAARLYLRILSAGGDLGIVGELKLPRSLVTSALDALDALLARTTNLADPVLLRAVAAVADDRQSVARLLRYIESPAGSVTSHCHSALYAVSRRARVRVLPDYTIVPVP
jgi:NACHT domain-containing protein